MKSQNISLAIVFFFLLAFQNELFANYLPDAVLQKYSSIADRILRLFVDRPIFGYFDQLTFSKENAGISRIGLAFDGEVEDTSAMGIDYMHRKQFRRTQFCNLSCGYKYYADLKNESYPFIDFSFLKTSIYDQALGSLILGAYLNIFDIKTTWFSKNDIDWVNIGLTMGWDFTSSSHDWIIAPLIHLGLCEETFNADTLTCVNLNNKYKVTQSQWLFFDAELKAVYKSLSLNFSSSVQGDGGNGLKTYKNTAELAYTLWLGRNPGTREQYFLNALKIYLSYGLEELSTEKFHYNYNVDVPYYVRYNTIKFGISARLGKLNFYPDEN